MFFVGGGVFATWGVRDRGWSLEVFFSGCCVGISPRVFACVVVVMVVVVVVVQIDGIDRMRPIRLAKDTCVDKRAQRVIVTHFTLYLVPYNH